VGHAGCGRNQLIELGIGDCSCLWGLMWKYRELPMDLADAALVWVAERERIRRCSRSTGGMSKFTGLIGSAASKSCLDRGGDALLF